MDSTFEHDFSYHVDAAADTNECNVGWMILKPWVILMNHSRPVLAKIWILS